MGCLCRELSEWEWGGQEWRAHLQLGQHYSPAHSPLCQHVEYPRCPARTLHDPQPAMSCYSCYCWGSWQRLQYHQYHQFLDQLTSSSSHSWKMITWTLPSFVEINQSINQSNWFLLRLILPFPSVWPVFFAINHNEKFIKRGIVVVLGIDLRRTTMHDQRSWKPVEDSNLQVTLTWWIWLISINMSISQSALL